MDNYRSIIERFETFAQNHPLIETFTWGQLSDVGRNNEKITFPLLHAIPTPSSIDNNYTDFNFQMLFMDMLDDTEENQLDILKIQHLILQDFLSEFQDATREYNYSIVTPVSFQPFLDRLPTRVCGVDATITFRVEASFCL